MAAPQPSPAGSLSPQASVRELIWKLYADLKAYRCAPTKQRKAALRARFDLSDAAYPVMARILEVRRDNLATTIAALEARLATVL